MTDLLNDPTALEAATLLTHYSFDLGSHTLEELMRYWLSRYPVAWVRAAIVEALYQGRYKAVSVDHILGLWHRRRQPCQHFNHEFERIICGDRIRALSKEVGAPLVAIATPPESLQRSDALLDEPAEAMDLDPDSVADELMLDPNPVEDVAAQQEWDLEPLTGIQIFRPEQGSELHLPSELSRQRSEQGHHPIHQFIPTADVPEFYTKLRSMSQLEPLIKPTTVEKPAAKPDEPLPTHTEEKAIATADTKSHD